MISGSRTDSPLFWLTLLAFNLFATLLLLVGRAATGGTGALLLGALLGIFVGLTSALLLIMIGMIALASPVATAVIILCCGLGAMWSRLAPLRPLA